MSAARRACRAKEQSGSLPTRDASNKTIDFDKTPSPEPPPRRPSTTQLPTIMPLTRSRSSKVLPALPKHLFGKHTTGKPRWKRKRRRAIPRPSPLGATCITVGPQGVLSISRTPTATVRHKFLLRKPTPTTQAQDPSAAAAAAAIELYPPNSLRTSLASTSDTYKRSIERTTQSFSNLTSDIEAVAASAANVSDRIASIRKRLEQARVR
ncbi:hypothetical protein OH76DRAFT_1480823 [Lentinus brumalis]|uniref:Uncharacterized protein n=1 Tax=Lentinus brumalis TaxID=2498619 RepID=A0A371DI55_9APHY|nr:hypothetical protein OH76DRAFT_1480823 [Polyporus brumalis]